MPNQNLQVTNAQIRGWIACVDKLAHKPFVFDESLVEFSQAMQKAQHFAQRAALQNIREFLEQFTDPFSLIPGGFSKEEPMPLDCYYVTFGIKYAEEIHPKQPWVNADTIVLIPTSDETLARLIAFELFDQYWASIYSGRNFSRIVRRDLTQVYQVDVKRFDSMGRLLSPAVVENK